MEYVSMKWDIGNWNIITIAPIIANDNIEAIGNVLLKSRYCSKN